MIECVTASCQTMVNDSARGINKDGTTRRNLICGRCLRLSKEARVCINAKCQTVLSKYAKDSKRCAKCVRLAIAKTPKKPNKFRVSRGVFIRDCSNGSTQYIKVGQVDKMGIIHLFKEAI